MQCLFILVSCNVSSPRKGRARAASPTATRGQHFKRSTSHWVTAFFSWPRMFNGRAHGRWHLGLVDNTTSSEQNPTVLQPKFHGLCARCCYYRPGNLFPRWHFSQIECAAHLVITVCTSRHFIIPKIHEIDYIRPPQCWVNIGPIFHSRLWANIEPAFALCLVLSV